MYDREVPPLPDWEADSVGAKVPARLGCWSTSTEHEPENGIWKGPRAGAAKFWAPLTSCRQWQPQSVECHGSRVAWLTGLPIGPRNRRDTYPNRWSGFSNHAPLAGTRRPLGKGGVRCSWRTVDSRTAERISRGCVCVASVVWPPYANEPTESPLS
jgi:hypothetical protein